jgi:hypothetical protein
MDKVQRIIVLIHCLLGTNKEFLYLFIVTTQQDAFTHNKEKKNVNICLQVNVFWADHVNRKWLVYENCTYV